MTKRPRSEEERWRGVTRCIALLIGAVVVSHWILDFVTHAPDLPLWPGHSRLVGLGLWRFVPATLLLEGIVFIAGITLYARATRPVDRIGSMGLWAVPPGLDRPVGDRALLPPPPSPRALAWFSFGWVDRHRTARATT